MPALDLIRPSVTAMRVIASVNAEFARELKLPPHIRSLGLISADSDDVTYIAADEATKQAMVEAVERLHGFPGHAKILRIGA